MADGKRVTALRNVTKEPAPAPALAPLTRQRRRQLESLVLDMARTFERVSGHRVTSIGLRRTAAGDIAAVDVEVKA